MFKGLISNEAPYQIFTVPVGTQIELLEE